MSTYHKPVSERIEVIAYSGYRGEEIPRTMILHNEKIGVAEILSSWMEEGLKNRARKRFFKIKGSDGNLYKIYFNEKVMEWYYIVCKREGSRHGDYFGTDWRGR